MTDVSGPGMSVPGRLGVTARVEEGDLVLELTPQRESLHHGVVRASVLSFIIDVVAGIPLDQDPDVWTLTSDMSVRMRPMPSPERIDATNIIVRQGRRTGTCLVELRTDRGEPIATGAIGFTKIHGKRLIRQNRTCRSGHSRSFPRSGVAHMAPARRGWHRSHPCGRRRGPGRGHMASQSRRHSAGGDGRACR